MMKIYSLIIIFSFFRCAAIRENTVASLQEAYDHVSFISPQTDKL